MTKNTHKLKKGDYVIILPKAKYLERNTGDICVITRVDKDGAMIAEATGKRIECHYAFFSEIAPVPFVQAVTLAAKAASNRRPGKLRRKTNLRP